VQLYPVRHLTGAGCGPRLAGCSASPEQRRGAERV